MKQYIIPALYSVILSIIFFHLNSMELARSNDDFQKFFANQELFSLVNGKQIFKLDILEDYVRNYEKEKPKSTEPIKIFSPDILSEYHFVLRPEYPSKVYSRVSSLKELCAYTILKDINKYNFDNLPIGELENIFKYPGFPQAVKESIFKAVVKKQGSAFFVGRYLTGIIIIRKKCIVL